MSIRKALTRTDHRPWPLPKGLWVMAQRWHDLAFVHWPLGPDALRPHVPPAMELDLFDGEAWVGVVPFRMSGVRLRGTPPVPGLSAFPELNVRTYVRCGDRPGVFFFSLDAGNRIAVAVARAWYHLPYFRARMRIDEADGRFRYRSRRIHRGAPVGELDMEYAPKGAPFTARSGTLEQFLTERYALYTTDRKGRLLEGEIHHVPWPLQEAEASTKLNTMARAGGIELPLKPPHVLFARRLDVAIWPLRKMEMTKSADRRE